MTHITKEDQWEFSKKGTLLSIEMISEGSRRQWEEVLRNFMIEDQWFKLLLSKRKKIREISGLEEGRFRRNQKDPCWQGSSTCNSKEKCLKRKIFQKKTMNRKIIRHRDLGPPGRIPQLGLEWDMVDSRTTRVEVELDMVKVILEQEWWEDPTLNNPAKMWTLLKRDFCQICHRSSKCHFSRFKELLIKFPRIKMIWLIS